MAAAEAPTAMPILAPVERAAGGEFGGTDPVESEEEIPVGVIGVDVGVVIGGREVVVNV